MAAIRVRLAIVSVFVLLVGRATAMRAVGQAWRPAHRLRLPPPRLPARMQSLSPGGSGAAAACRRVLRELQSDEWEPLRTRSRWQHPCLISSCLTALSVVAAARCGLLVPFGVGPSLVLLSSLLYWTEPRKESVRRTIE